jgi:hypothetical protein
VSQVEEHTGASAPIYASWAELLTWMQEIARERGLRYQKISDFPDYIYRMERPYDLPVTTASASICDRGGVPLLLASVSPRHVAAKSVQLRLMGGSRYWHLHAGAQGLQQGSWRLDRARLEELVEQASKQAEAR